MEAHSSIHSILAWRIPWTEGLTGYSPWNRKELDMTEQLTHTHTHTHTQERTDNKQNIYFHMMVSALEKIE